MNPARWLTAAGPLGHRLLFAQAVAFTALGIGCGSLLFPTEASLIGVVLVAFSQAGTAEKLLDRNRDEIWGKLETPRRANAKLAAGLLVLFLGVFVTYLAAVQVTPSHRLHALFDRQLGDFAAGDLTEVHFGTFRELLRRNGVVFFGCFAFALIYRHAGMLLVLAWNASSWGVVFSYLALRAAGEADDPLEVSAYLGKTLLSILPHLVLEALAYVLVAMCGVFTSRGVARHKLSSPQFLQVAKAILRILATAFAVLAAAAAVEAWLAPALVDALFAS